MLFGIAIMSLFNTRHGLDQHDKSVVSTKEAKGVVVRLKEKGLARDCTTAKGRFER